MLQADAFAGFNRLYASARRPGPLVEEACWAHARRKLFVLADVAANRAYDLKRFLWIEAQPVAARKWLGTGLRGPFPMIVRRPERQSDQAKAAGADKSSTNSSNGAVLRSVRSTRSCVEE